VERAHHGFSLRQCSDCTCAGVEPGLLAPPPPPQVVPLPRRERGETDLVDAYPITQDGAAAAPGVDLAALLTSSPRNMAWRERRRFDSATALKEGVWSPAQQGTNLTPKDREIVADICFSSDSVFETGVGESTKICTFTGVPRYTGVDNALEWLQNVMRTAPAHYRFHWADIGPIADYSQPTDPKSEPKWPLASFAALAAEDRPFDFYFVDGRFRVASFAANMLHALLRGKRDALFAIHDYSREDYHPGCESIGEIVRGFGRDHGAEIAVFKMKAGLTAEDIIAVWHEHKFLLR